MQKGRGSRRTGITAEEMKWEMFILFYFLARLQLVWKTKLVMQLCSIVRVKICNILLRVLPIPYC